MPYIGSRPPDRPINSLDITDGTIANTDLAASSVTTHALATDSVISSKLNLISTVSVPSLEAKGTSGVTEGYIQLNCAENSHGIKLKSPPHSAGQSYTLTFPQAISNNGFLKTDGSGNLSFSEVAAGSSTVLVADGSITAGKPVAITPEGKVKQISATGYTQTEVIGSTVATSSLNADYSSLGYDESNDEVIAITDVSGTIKVARITLDSSLNTAYTGEHQITSGQTVNPVGVGLKYSPKNDRMWFGPMRMTSNPGTIGGTTGTGVYGALIRNNSGTLSSQISERFNATTTAAPYGSCEVNRTTGALFLAGSNNQSNMSGVGFANTSSEIVFVHSEQVLGVEEYGQSYEYYAGFRDIPGTGLVYFRGLYNKGMEVLFPTFESTDITQFGAVQNGDAGSGHIARIGQTQNNSDTGQFELGAYRFNTKTQQHFFPHMSVWHPWAKRLLMPGKSPGESGCSSMQTMTFHNQSPMLSGRITLDGAELQNYNGPNMIPIPNTNAFVRIFTDGDDSNKLKYFVIDIKLGAHAGEDTFVVSAEREIAADSFTASKSGASAWNQQRQAIVVSGNHTSQTRYYGLKPQLAVSNARNFIGFASSTVSDGQNLTVDLSGSVTSNQSSLVVGRRYIVAHDGTLKEFSNDDQGQAGMPFAGTALSATTLLIGPHGDRMTY